MLQDVEPHKPSPVVKLLQDEQELFIRNNVNADIGEAAVKKYSKVDSNIHISSKLEQPLLVMLLCKYIILQLQ